MMNNFCHSCGCDLCKCKKSCNPCGGCSPACSKPYFDLIVDPYDPNYYLWELNGETGRVRIPKTDETDTTLSLDYSNSTLNYKAERHTDVLTGSQLGSIINLDDLRDVDATNPDACSLLVFNPACGLCPCSPEDERWEKYTIPDATESITPDSQDRYKVLVKSDCGCIKEAYIPAMPDLDCVLTNVMNAVAPFAGDGQFKDLESGQITPSGESTPGFAGYFNPNTGEFEVSWHDWVTYEWDDPLAEGKLTGRLTTTKSFDWKTGNMIYTITKIYYDTVTYHVIKEDSRVSDKLLTLTFWGAFPGTNLQGDKDELTANGYRIFGPNSLYVRLGNDYTTKIDKTFTGTKVVTIGPNGGTSDWFDLVRIFNDWTDADDDGVVQGRYRNPMEWTECEVE